MIVENAHLTDLEDIVQLSIQGRSYHNRILGNYFNDIDTDFERSFLSKAITDENQIVLVTRLDNKIVGFLLAVCSEKPWLAAPKVCSIENICVDESVRRQGIGRAMIECVRTECAKKEIKQLTLGVFCANKNAIPFYEACGFEPLSIKMSMWI